MPFRAYALLGSAVSSGVPASQKPLYWSKSATYYATTSIPPLVSRLSIPLVNLLDYFKRVNCLQHEKGSTHRHTRVRDRKTAVFWLWSYCSVLLHNADRTRMI